MPLTHAEIIEFVENMPDIRIELLKQGHNAIYVDKNISNEPIMLQPNGKCYFIRSNYERKINEIVRELTKQEYIKLDLLKGKDF